LERSYTLYADQDRPLAEDPNPSGASRSDAAKRGTGQVVITLSDIEIEEFAAALRAFIALRYLPRAVDESSAEDPDRSTEAAAVDESSAGDLAGTGSSGPSSRQEAPMDGRDVVGIVSVFFAGLLAGEELVVRYGTRPGRHAR
jgi:hypothetical protein